MKWGIIIGIIGGVIGLLGFIVGAGVAIAADPTSGIIFTVIFVLIFGVAFLPFFFLLIKPSLENKKLNKIGLDAVGTILELRDTGVTVNMNPEIELILDVKPNDGTANFQSKARVLISRLQTSIYQPGTTLPVKYLPDDTSKVAVAER